MERTVQKGLSFVGGALACLAAATPALAATPFTLHTVLASFGTREWLLAAAGVLLAIALIGRQMRGRETTADVLAIEEAPDLRWWRNPVTAAWS